MKKLLLLSVVIIFFSHNLSSQNYVPKTPLMVNIDISRFRLPPDKGYLEVYYATYLNNVTLESIHDTLQGSVVMQLKVVNKNNDSLVIYSSVTVPMTTQDTTAFQRSHVGKLIYELPFGSYELVVQSCDSRNSARRDSTRKTFSIDKYNGSPAVSDIDVCSQIVQSDDKKNTFYKNSYEVVPNPSLVFGGKNEPVVFSYAELYDLNLDSTYLIITRIADGKGRLLKERKNIRRFTGRNVVDVNTLNITAIPTGKYRFLLILADTLGKEITHSEKQIFIYSPQIASAPLTALSAKSVEFAGLSEEELIDEFRKAKYIATDELIKMFEKKVTTLVGRREFMANFWVNVENGQEGITRKLYLERVSIADQRYPAMGIQGWHTDRGRVYILNGEPDEVQRFPVSDNAKPYEIWLYNQIENGIQFIFVDRSGYGNYSLVHSTKRGEIKDEGWERNLR